MIKKSLILIGITIGLITGSAVYSESLFTLGAAQSYAGVPKSLYSGVQARQIGDLISIVMTETISLSDNLAYTSAKESKTVDSFTSFLKEWIGFPTKFKSNGYGGSNEVTNSAANTRSMSFKDTVAVQVVQQLANGNLAVQGKKTVVNGNERVDLIVTGLVDPRWINDSGQVYSYHVANLQFAVNGRGTISRGQNEGIFNRFIKYLF